MLRQGGIEMPAKTVGMTGGEGRKNFQLEENKHAVEATGITRQGGAGIEFTTFPTNVVRALQKSKSNKRKT